MSEKQNNQTFDFATAVKHLHDGKKVRCVDWAPCLYICFSDSSPKQLVNPDGIEYAINPAFAYRVQWELYND